MSRYEQFEISLEMIEEELRPVDGEQRQTDLTFSPLYRPVPPALGSPFLRLKPPS